MGAVTISWELLHVKHYARHTYISSKFSQNPAKSVIITILLVGKWKLKEINKVCGLKWEN